MKYQSACLSAVSFGVSRNHPRGFRLFQSLHILLGFVLSCGVLSASELWEEYERGPDTHPNIPNCSYAGYEYGEKQIPEISGPVYNVKNYGALGNGSTDDTAAIRAALAAVGSEGGVVYFPDGVYPVSGVLFVHTNHTVMRGQSREGTQILFTQPLERGYGTRFYTTEGGETASRWSYSGGLIWFGPLSRGNTYRNAPPDSPILIYESWLTTGAITPVSGIYRRGDRRITLENPHSLVAGDWILLKQQDPGDYSLVKHLSGGGSWADAFDWINAPGGASWPQPSPQQWIVEIASVNGNTLTLRQPLRFDVRPEWTPTVQSLGTMLLGSGIETMTLAFARDYEWIEGTHHHIEAGWNGPFFNNAIHCWLRDVTMIDMDNGPNLTSAKNITLANFTLKASGPATMSHHHGAICRSSSHDILFSDFHIESKPWHGMNVESYSSGNVWIRGLMAHGVFDSHRKIPFEGLRSDITLVENDGAHGGSGGPLMGARFANWNVRSLSGRNYIVGWANAMPSGAIVGLQGTSITWNAHPTRTPTGEGVSGCRIEGSSEIPSPYNLYRAQLALRRQTCGLLDECFSPGQRLTADLPTTSAWNTSLSSGVSDAEGSLVCASNRHVLTYFTPQDSAAHLEKGDVLRVEFKFEITNPLASNGTFRIALLDSGGIRLSDNTGLTNALFKGHTGYGAFLNFSKTSAASLYRRDDKGALATGKLIHGNDDYTSLASNLGTGAVFTNGSRYTGRLELLQATEGMRVSFSIPELDGYHAEFIDTASPYTDFDTFVLYGASGGMTAYSVDSVEILHIAAPSPTELLDEQFSPGQRLSVNLPTASAWYASSSSGVGDSSGSLTAPANRHILTYFTPVNSVVSLDFDDLLQVEFKFKITNPLASNGTFRVALLDSNGFRLSDNTGLTNALFKGYTGYGAFLNFNKTSAASLYRRDDKGALATGKLIHGNDDYTSLASNLGTGASIVGETLYTGRLELSRFPDGIQVSLSIPELGGYHAEFIDTTSAYTNFDTFVIYGASSGMSGFTVESVKVKHLDGARPPFGGSISE